MRVAAALGARTLTMPAISAGIYGYPLEEAAAIAVGTVADELQRASPLQRITFVLFSRDTFAAFERALTALG